MHKFNLNAADISSEDEAGKNKKESAPDAEDNDFELSAHDELEKIHKKIMEQDESADNTTEEHSPEESAAEEPKKEARVKNDIKHPHHFHKESSSASSSSPSINSHELLEIKQLLKELIEIFRQASEEIKTDEFSDLKNKVDYLMQQNNSLAYALSSLNSSLGSLHMKTDALSQQNYPEPSSPALPTSSEELTMPLPQVQVPMPTNHPIEQPSIPSSSQNINPEIPQRPQMQMPPPAPPQFQNPNPRPKKGLLELLNLKL